MPAPSDADSARRMLVSAAVFVPIAGLAARGYTGGWFFLLLGPIYLAIAVLHAVFHIRTAKRGALRGRPAVTKIIASHLALLVAFMLQWDIGDGPSWLTISALLTRGQGSREAQWLSLQESHAIIYDLALFLPVVGSYLIINRSRV